jgi:hypothetical protein
MSSQPSCLLLLLTIGFVAYLALVGASLQEQDPDAATPFFEKMNRLNYHYYVHDDANYTRNEKNGFIVRLGRAHYWKYS